MSETERPYPVDAEGRPTKAYLESLDTKAKWDDFMATADERGRLRGLIHLTDLAYGEPE